jgi:hypothetical protein
LAEALAMMTTKAASFLLNGPCERFFKNEVMGVDKSIYGVQIAEESTARDKGLREDTQNIGDNGEKHQ